MNIGLSNEIRRCYNEGKADEAMVAELLVEKCGGKCFDSTEYDDIRRHVDIWWDSPKGGIIGVDVKGMRKNSRKDNKKDGTIQWLEIRNVQGDKGWIFGDMDYIAFITTDDVVFVKPSDLYGRVLLNIAGKELVNVLPSDFYIPYQRSGRKDIIVKVPVSELYEICHFKVSR